MGFSLAMGLSPQNNLPETTEPEWSFGRGEGQLLTESHAAQLFVCLKFSSAEIRPKEVAGSDL